MFKSKNEPVMVKQPEPSVNSFTSNTNTNIMDSIAEGTVFTGNITASKGIKINGIVKTADFYIKKFSNI